MVLIRNLPEVSFGPCQYLIAGAWSKEFIKEDTTFGPYEGEKKKISDNCDPYYSWEIKGPTGRRLFCIDAANPNKSNWMRYIKCARYYEEQNMVAMQHQKEIYYKTIKDVNAGEELLCWYNIPLPSEETYNKTNNAAVEEESEVKEVKKRGRKRKYKKNRKQISDPGSVDEEKSAGRQTTNSQKFRKVLSIDEHLKAKGVGRRTRSRGGVFDDAIDGDFEEDSADDEDYDTERDGEMKGDIDDEREDKEGEGEEQIEPEIGEKRNLDDQGIQMHFMQRSEKKRYESFHENGFQTLKSKSPDVQNEIINRSRSINSGQRQVNENGLTGFQKLDQIMKYPLTINRYDKPQDGVEKRITSAIGDRLVDRRYRMTIRKDSTNSEEIKVTETDGIPELDRNSEQDDTESEGGTKSFPHFLFHALRLQGCEKVYSCIINILCRLYTNFGFLYDVNQLQ
ncbi:uncharacterized protein LOC144451759 [Glandiceps talaboti]